MKKIRHDHPMYTANAQICTSLAADDWRHSVNVL